MARHEPIDIFKFVFEPIIRKRIEIQGLAQQVLGAAIAAYLSFLKFLIQVKKFFKMRPVRHLRKQIGCAEHFSQQLDVARRPHDGSKSCVRSVQQIMVWQAVISLAGKPFCLP